MESGHAYELLNRRHLEHGYHLLGNVGAPTLVAMKKASEYRQHAQECRYLAAQMPSDDQRASMLRMADHWDKLAADRIALIEKHPELAHEGEHDEERSWRTAGRPRASREPPTT